MKNKFERKHHKPDLEFWFRPDNGKIVIENQYNRAKFKEFLKKENGQWVKADFRKKDKPKSRELLGFLFGGLYPLYILHGKGIEWKDEPFFVVEQYKQGNLTSEEIDETHATFMTEFCPMMTYDLKTGTPHKQRGELKKMNQRETMIYVADVCEWFLENIGFIPQVEEYKKIRDGFKLIREEGIQVEYPNYQGTPTF